MRRLNCRVPRAAMSDRTDVSAAVAPEPPHHQGSHAAATASVHPAHVVAVRPGVAAAAASVVSIERQTMAGRELLLYSALLVLFDVGKTVTSYALKYYNDGKYPVAQTLIVFLTEDTKLAAVVGYLMLSGGSHRDVSLSLKFVVPSALYACTNNLYLLAFHYTTPAVWNILAQSRIVITAVVYRVLFKKSVGAVQWLALALLTFAICFTQLPRSGAGTGGGGELVQPFAILLALLSSVLSVAASVFMEYTFKNDRRSFVDQQLQLSLYSALVSLALCWLDASRSGDKQQAVGPIVFWRSTQSGSAGLLLPVLFVACVVLGATCGLITGIVIKRLDNIVKIYSQALCGIINAIICMAIFPDNFLPDWRYCVSLFLVIISIIMYEKSSAITSCVKS